MKIGFLFPGQGAQYVGMGKDLYEKYDEAKKIYDMAEKITNEPIKLNILNLQYLRKV